MNISSSDRKEEIQILRHFNKHLILFQNKTIAIFIFTFQKRHSSY